MSDADQGLGKESKKAAKAAAKRAKKQAKVEGKAAAASALPRDAPSEGNSLAERSARAAEQKVALERWRVTIAAIGVIVALATLAITITRGC